MDFITTTELRTKTTELVNALTHGQSVRLIHRSRIVGTFQPIQGDRDTFDAREFAQLAKESSKIHGDIPKSRTAQEKIYREHLIGKYA